MKIKKIAINLFKRRYGRTPEDAGFPEISFYEKQGVFIYATSEAVIKAYKTGRNITNWMRIWYLWPVIVACVIYAIAFYKYVDYGHPLCIACYIFFGIWVGLLIILRRKVRQAMRLIKLKKNIIILPYSGEEEFDSPPEPAEKLPYVRGSRPVEQPSKFTYCQRNNVPRTVKFFPRRERGKPFDDVVGIRVSDKLMLLRAVLFESQHPTDILEMVTACRGRFPNKEEIWLIYENRKRINQNLWECGEPLLQENGRYLYTCGDPKEDERYNYVLDFSNGRFGTAQPEELACAVLVETIF